MTTDNINICDSRELLTPMLLKQQLPMDDTLCVFVNDTRDNIKKILNKEDKRLLFVVGPCSIHNVEEAKNYANELKTISDQVKENILIVMRVYYEKPRTSIGWKGLINDPDINNSLDVNKGLYMTRELLLYINKIGLPCGCEFLDIITPHYFSDLISWGAIGARTSESQIHRQMVSGLSMPIGFKNNRSGNLNIPCDSVKAAFNPQSFIGINDNGKSSVFITGGNKYSHTILRGSDNSPNFKMPSIIDLMSKLKDNYLPLNVMIDCSHGNSGGNFKNQRIVLNHSIANWLNNDRYIMGIMMESNINEGSQPIKPLNELKYGVSITDGCIGLQETTSLIINSHLLIKHTKMNRN